MQNLSLGITKTLVLFASPNATVLYESQHIPLSSSRIKAAIISRICFCSIFVVVTNSSVRQIFVVLVYEAHHAVRVLLYVMTVCILAEKKIQWIGQIPRIDKILTALSLLSVRKQARQLNLKHIRILSNDDPLHNCCGRQVFSCLGVTPFANKRLWGYSILGQESEIFL